MEHIIKESLLESTVKVALVGAGGTGSQVLTGLARLHRAMLALGHPGGLHVTVLDPDLVSEANVGRQLFSDSDVGFSKAVVLVHRINLYYGLSWKAEADRAYNLHEHDIVIGCVDTRSSRRDIHRQIHNGYRQPCYWLDIGNRASDGQVILGQPKPGGKSFPERLPTVVDLFPEILDESNPETDDGPSCSLAEALDHQELFINQAMATFGLDLLWKMFRHGKVDHHGVFVNLSAGRTSPLPVDKEVWKRFGYNQCRRNGAHKQKNRKKAA